MPADRKVEMPTLYVAGKRDNVLQPAMSAGMEKTFPKLTRAEVNTAHWALWEDADGVNAILRQWLIREVPNLANTQSKI